MANIKQKLGARIQEIRKSKNITQEKLAEKIEMDTPNLSNIERGKKFMTSDTLEKIIMALDITEKELFDFEHTQKSELELINEITQTLKTLNLKELKYIYKMTNEIKQMR